MGAGINVIVLTSFRKLWAVSLLLILAFAHNFEESAAWLTILSRAGVYLIRGVPQYYGNANLELLFLNLF